MTDFQFPRFSLPLTGSRSYPRISSRSIVARELLAGWAKQHVFAVITAVNASLTAMAPRFGAPLCGPACAEKWRLGADAVQALAELCKARQAENAS